MNDQNFKNLCLKVFSFVKLFFVFVFYCTARRCSEIKIQLKVVIEGGREAP